MFVFMMYDSFIKWKLELDDRSKTQRQILFTARSSSIVFWGRGEPPRIKRERILTTNVFTQL
ncbi:hypothetical protein K470DRAFT_62240 [Piedraia hortae CBS 480.64]|uniref:Uncharacterized protein n=1 Tax=Piedraia hortae CBS 480.64 TaxID=1314780 RepID=A0A6A7BZU9_9PEZI|nr:hypothetical protein K470DRAFT_62240 [Piedraia hortae CBS 480.64]